MADTLRFLWSGSLMAVATALLCGFAAYVFSSRLAPSYDATSTVYATNTPVGDRWLGTVTYSPSRLDANAYGFAAVNDSVLTSALAMLGDDEVSQAEIARLGSRVRISLDETSTASFIHITLRDASPEAAASKANAVANALVEWDNARARVGLNQIGATLEAQLASLEQAAADLASQSDPVATRELAANIETQAQLRTNLRLVRALALESSGSLAVFQTATQSDSPAAPSAMMNTALAFVFGLVLGYGIVLIYQTIRAARKDVSTLLVRG